MPDTWDDLVTPVGRVANAMLGYLPGVRAMRDVQTHPDPYGNVMAQARALNEHLWRTPDTSNPADMLALAMMSVRPGGSLPGSMRGNQPRNPPTARDLADTPSGGPGAPYPEVIRPPANENPSPREARSKFSVIEGGKPQAAGAPAAAGWAANQTGSDYDWSDLVVPVTPHAMAGMRRAFNAMAAQ